MSHYRITIYGSQDWEEVLEDGEYRGDLPHHTWAIWQGEDGPREATLEGISFLVKDGFNAPDKVIRIVGQSMSFRGPLANRMEAKLREVLGTPGFLYEARSDDPKIHSIQQLDNGPALQPFMTIEYFGPPKADVWIM